MKREVVNINGTDIEAYYGRAHKYKSLELISKAGTGARILDVGGGDRRLNLPNFVNLDVASDSKFVDVVGNAHNLPFKDNTFDLIFCESALEHMRKPWLTAEELYRVLKRGGFIYVDVAFMHPVHSCPGHYFNMTKEGIEALFQSFIKISSGVGKHQMPSYTLIMVLSGYIRCFLPALDKIARNVKVYDTGMFKSPRLGLPLVLVYKALVRFLRFFDRFINPERAEEIAAGVYFIGTKV